MIGLVVDALKGLKGLAAGESPTRKKMIAMILQSTCKTILLGEFCHRSSKVLSEIHAIRAIIWPEAAGNGVEGTGVENKVVADTPVRSERNAPRCRIF